MDLDSTPDDPMACFENLRPSLQLIDFGRCIDMKMYPEGKTFTHCFKKEEHKTPEMLDGKPWSYQVCTENIKYKTMTRCSEVLKLLSVYGGFSKYFTTSAGKVSF